jgi:uncharacterized membrane protein
MTILLSGLVLFFAVHSVSIVRDDWRARVVARIGEPAWKGVFSLLSLAGLVLIVWGYGLARQAPVVVYTPPVGLRHGALLLLLFVFPLVLAAYLPGRIQSTMKHPLLVATKLWALVHLFANGTLADVALFGSFLLWAVADRISLGRRTPRPVPGAPPSRANDAIAVVGGLALYVAFVLWLHRWLIGVPPVG